LTKQQATTSTDPSRRQVLCGLAVALLAPGALAAACGGDPGTTATTTTGGAGGTTTGGGATTTTGGGATGALAKLSDVPVGGGLIVDGPSGKVLLVQPAAGTVKGYDPTCPHQGFTVDPPKDGIITCVQGHGSQFDPNDGSVKRDPATSPLTRVEVTVQGDSVVLA